MNILEKPLEKLCSMQWPTKIIRVGAPIQIKVYKDRIMIWNDGHLPENWTISNLLQKHSSKPFNPDIANTLFRSGYIESWGRGIEKMMNYCKEANIPVPHYSFEGSDFLVEFRKDIYHEEYLTDLGLNQRQIKAVLFLKEKGKITNKEYQEINNTLDRTALRDLEKLLEIDIIQKVGEKKGTYYEIKF